MVVRAACLPAAEAKLSARVALRWWAEKLSLALVVIPKVAWAWEQGLVWAAKPILWVYPVDDLAVFLKQAHLPVR